MIGVAQDRQVLPPIVLPIPVDVVDVLIGGKLATEDLLHNETMLQLVLADPGFHLDVSALENGPRARDELDSELRPMLACPGAVDPLAVLGLARGDLEGPAA